MTHTLAGMAELADATDLKSVDGNIVPVRIRLPALNKYKERKTLVMKNVMNTITIEQLDSVNVSLANRIRLMGEKLKTNDRHKSSYWVNVEMTNGKMYLCADNGFDISEDIEVGTNDIKQIKAFINSGP